jgi:hypothetical protein
VKIEITSRSEPRVREALQRRAQLMRMSTGEMPGDWLEQMRDVETTISAAVARAVLAQQV